MLGRSNSSVHAIYVTLHANQIWTLKGSDVRKSEIRASASKVYICICQPGVRFLLLRLSCNRIFTLCMKPVCEFWKYYMQCAAVASAVGRHLHIPSCDMLEFALVAKLAPAHLHPKTDQAPITSAGWSHPEPTIRTMQNCAGFIQRFATLAYKCDCTVRYDLIRIEMHTFTFIG